MNVAILNNFSHLIVNAEAYFDAAIIIKEKEIEVDRQLEELHKSKQFFKTSLPLFLFKPRDHLFAIAIELLGKSIINEYEKSLDFSKVPKIEKYRHRLIDIYVEARKYLNLFNLLESINDNQENTLLDKLTEILYWASRYQYGGKSVNHVKRIAHKSGIGLDGTMLNLTLNQEDINNTINLFYKYHHLHNLMIKYIREKRKG